MAEKLHSHTTEVLVINRRKELEFLLKELVKNYTHMVKGLSNPLIRPIIRCSAGGENYGVLKNYITGKASTKIWLKFDIYNIVKLADRFQGGDYGTGRSVL